MNMLDLLQRVTREGGVTREMYDNSGAVRQAMRQNVPTTGANVQSFISGSTGMPAPAPAPPPMPTSAQHATVIGAVPGRLEDAMVMTTAPHGGMGGQYERLGSLEDELQRTYLDYILRNNPDLMEQDRMLARQRTLAPIELMRYG